MSERLRGVLALLGACLVTASVAFFSWRLAVGVAGLFLLGAAFKDGKRTVTK